MREDAQPPNFPSPQNPPISSLPLGSPELTGRSGSHRGVPGRCPHLCRDPGRRSDLGGGWTGRQGGQITHRHRDPISPALHPYPRALPVPCLGSLSQDNPPVQTPPSRDKAAYPPLAPAPQDGGISSPAQSQTGAQWGRYQPAPPWAQRTQESCQAGGQLPGGGVKHFCELRFQL